MKRITVLILLAATMGAASAEKADKTKQMAIEQDVADIDNVSQTTILTGNVVITQGTLLMKSEKATVQKDAEGYNVLTLLGAPGKVATFRQKRDGGPDLWIEGQAEKIVYDEKQDTVRLFANAKIRELEGARMTHEVASPFISYDSRTEQFASRNDVSGQSVPGKGRSVVIIEPRKPQPAAPKPAAPASAAAASSASVPAPGK